MEEERTFDRLVEFDERSRSFPIRTAVKVDKPRSYTWHCDTVLDQGRERACVGFSWAHEAACLPVPRRVTERVARDIYREAQRLDHYPDDVPGTSVLAGAKAMMNRGWLREYRWAFGLQDALIAISRFGPAVLGVNWYEGMKKVDDRGFIHVEGGITGGHAILANGVNVSRHTVTLHNSWGRKWGKDGQALISWDDLERLLGEQGEVCVPVLR